MSEINAHPGINESWALEQQHQIRAYEESSKVAWAAEFGSPPQIHSPPPPVRAVQQQPSYMSSLGSYASPIPRGIYSMSPPTMQYGNNPNFSILNQGKGKSKEADFEAAFAQVAASLNPIEAQTSGVEEVDDSIADIEETLKNVSFKSDVEEDETDFSRYDIFISLININLCI
jgi:peroxin-5